MATKRKTEIKKSFVKLLQKHPIRQITVKDIVTECELNRNSFYYYFDDIPSLAEEIVTEEAENLITQHPDINSIEELLDESISFMLGKKSVILHIYKSAERSMFEFYLMKFCRHISAKYLNTILENTEINNSLSEEELKTVEDFIAAAAFGQICNWLSQDMSYDAKAKYRSLMSIFKSDTNKEFLKKLFL